MQKFEFLPLGICRSRALRLISSRPRPPPRVFSLSLSLSIPLSSYPSPASLGNIRGRSDIMPFSILVRGCGTVLLKASSRLRVSWPAPRSPTRERKGKRDGEERPNVFDGGDVVFSPSIPRMNIPRDSNCIEKRHTEDEGRGGEQRRARKTIGLAR